MINTKTLIAASVLVAGLATSASASESFLMPNSLFNQQPVVQSQRTVQATQAYAYAPANTQRNAFTTAEQREFDRVSADAVSAH